MPDLTLFTDCGPLCSDLRINCGDLVRGNDLQTATLISLFSDARDDQKPDDTGDPRGWWAEPIGSRLWTLEHSLQLPETLRLWEDYSREALAWLIKDGVAASVAVVAAYEDCYLVFSVAICKPNGTTEKFRYRYVWNDLNATLQCLSNAQH